MSETENISASGLDPTRVRAALERVLSEADYDLHKAYLCDEETGEDDYPGLVDLFIRQYGEENT